MRAGMMQSGELSSVAAGFARCLWLESLLRFMIRFIGSFRSLAKRQTRSHKEMQKRRSLASPRPLARSKGTKQCPDWWFHNRPTYLPLISLCNTICDAEVSACVCACVRGRVCLCVVCTEERRRRRRRGRRRRRRRRRRSSDLSMCVCVSMCARLFLCV